MDISIIDRGILSIEEIDGDTFFTNITLNDNIAAGGYILNIKAYEIYKNEVSNYGEKNFTININQVLRDVGLDLETRNVTPGYNVSYKVSLYDQSGELIEGAVSASIEDVSGETKAYESASGEINYIKLERNAKEGFWKIHTESGGLAVEDSFYVQKNEEIDVYLDENGTLIVENVGNAPYAKDVKFIIGDEIVYKSIALNIGESKKYDVSAPEGVYDIQVEEEGKNIQLDGVALTGNEISIDEIRGDGGISWIIVLVIAIIIVLALIAFLILKKFKKKSGEIHGSATSEKEYKFKMPHKKGDLELLKVPLLKAEHSLVIKGPKEEATLVAVKIKNAHSIKGNESSAMETLEKVSAYICDKKGAVYLTGEYVIGIFSPRLTKTFKNINLGIQVAKEINDMLKKHNQNFNQKIVYGIGVNCGVIISDIGKEIVKFTWLGNEISVSKKIADMAEMKILISDEVKKKLDSSIRTRVEDEKKKLYGIDRINDREEHKEFIQHFLKRQEERKESLKKK